MAEITQKLGFDASQAVSSLNSLDSALKGVNRQLTLFNKGTGPHPETTRHFQQTAKQAQAAEAALRKTATQFQRTGQQGAAAGRAITLSWQTMLRIVQTQVLFSALNRLVGLFNDSAKAAAEFQIEVARISTIARGPGSSIAELSNSLNDLSRELGRPITEVTSAAFQALQNDLGTTAETMNLLGGAAHELALITGGDLTQAVNAISSVLKSYNLDISEAKDISDIFFTTIDTGRITLDELQNSLGTLAPLASQVGISFQELAGSTAAITQSGTGGATAMTQLRNVVQKLVKPTEALQAAFQKLGVASGRELVAQTGGLIPALEALRDVVNGDEQAIAAMFGTIRGQLGVFNLLANDSQIVNNILGEMENRAGRASDALNKIEATNGRELARQMENVNAAIRELGESTLSVQISLLKFVTGSIQGFEQLINVITAVGSTMDRLLNPDGGESAGIVKLLGGISTGVVTLGLGLASALEGFTGLNVGATNALQTLLKSTAEATIKARELANKRVRESASQAEKAISKELAEEVKIRKGIMEGYLKSVDEIYKAEVASFQQRSQEMIAIQEGTLATFESVSKSISSQIDAFFANGAERLQQRMEAAKNAAQELADFRFDRDLAGRSGRSQAFKLEEEAAKRTKEALEALREADRSGSEEARKAALEETKAAAAFEKRAQAAAKSAGLMGKHEASLERQEDLLEANATATKKWEDAERTAQQNITKFDGETTKARIANINALLAKQAELQKEREAPGTTDQRRAEIDAELADISNQFSTDLARLSQDQLLKHLTLDKVFEQAALEASSALNRVRSEWQGARESLQAALDRGPFKAVAEVVDKAVATPTGNQVVDNAIQDTSAGFTDIQNSADKARELTAALEKVKEEARQAEARFRAQGIELNNNQAATNKLVGELTNVDTTAKSTVSSIGALNQQIGEATGEQLGSLTSELERLQANVKTQIESGVLAGEQAKKVQEAIQALYDQIENRRAQLQAEGLFGNGVVEAANAALEQISTSFAALDLGISPERAAQMLQPLNDATTLTAQQMTDKLVNVATTMGTQFSQQSTVAGNAVKGIQPIINSINTAGAIQQMNALAAAAQRALALARAAAAAGGGGAQHHGGPIYKAQGGTVPRGVDTRIVAMQPGEFVMNARSSRKFASQLQAMNGGQTPQFREAGGPVTNIGDINVSVNSQPGETVSGRDVAIALRRELRRQTSKPF